MTARVFLPGHAGILTVPKYVVDVDLEFSSLSDVVETGEATPPIDDPELAEVNFSGVDPSILTPSDIIEDVLKASAPDGDKFKPALLDYRAKIFDESNFREIAQPRPDFYSVVKDKLFSDNVTDLDHVTGTGPTEIRDHYLLNPTFDDLKFKLKSNLEYLTPLLRALRTMTPQGRFTGVLSREQLRGIRDQIPKGEHGFVPIVAPGYTSVQYEEVLMRVAVVLWNAHNDEPNPLQSRQTDRDLLQVLGLLAELNLHSESYEEGLVATVNPIRVQFRNFPEAWKYIPDPGIG